jgi:hypothetical protein
MRCLPPQKKGEVLTFTYLPGVGALMRGQGQELTIRGKDFVPVSYEPWFESIAGPGAINGDPSHET